MSTVYNKQPILPIYRARVDSVDDINSTGNLSNASSSSPIIPTDQIYIATRKRWLVLFGVSLFGLANSIADSEASILHTFTDLMGISVNHYVYIGLVFSYIPLFTAIPAAWIVDRYGMKVALYISAFATMVKCVFRSLLYSPNTPNWQHINVIYWILSNVIGAQVVVIYWCAPLKISETWFTESERSTAWATMTSATLIGYSIAGFMYPRLMESYKNTDPLLYVVVACTFVSVMVVFFCITSSKPKHPPTERSLISINKKRDSYLQTIKKIALNRDLLLNAIHISFFEGVYMSVLAVQQDILLASGHTEIFVGNLISINAIIGLIMFIILSAFVHQVKDIVFVCKLGSVMKTFLFIGYIAALLYPLSDWIVMTVSIIYSLCKYWTLPNLNNMTAHLASGYISEAAAAGLQTTLVLFLSSINQVAFMSLRKEDEKGQPDYSYSMLFLTVVALVNTALYVVVFKGRQMRQETNCDINNPPNQRATTSKRIGSTD